MPALFSKKNIILGTVVILAVLGAVFLYAKPVPAKVILQVPFTPQAPLGNWNRNEDCEETSIAMATAFLNGQTEDKMPAADAEKAIGQLKSWENANIGYNANTGADATTKMAEGAFGLHVQQIADYTEDDLKQALNQNHPVLLPINAQDLHNPKYLNGGPLYHMILVRGYTGDTFIINDPGTDSGDGNEYSFATLKSAAADWDNTKQAMNPTRKIALVLSK